MFDIVAGDGTVRLKALLGCMLEEDFDHRSRKPGRHTDPDAVVASEAIGHLNNPRQQLRILWKTLDLPRNEVLEHGSDIGTVGISAMDGEPPLPNSGQFGESRYVEILSQPHGATSLLH